MQLVIYGPQMAMRRDGDVRQAFLQRFGRNLRLLRIERGLSQRQLAELVGVHRTFVGQLERGQVGMNITELPHFARALGIGSADLLPEPPHAPDVRAPDVRAPDVRAPGTGPAGPDRGRDAALARRR